MAPKDNDGFPELLLCDSCGGLFKTNDLLDHHLACKRKSKAKTTPQAKSKIPPSKPKSPSRQYKDARARFARRKELRYCKLYPQPTQEKDESVAHYDHKLNEWERAQKAFVSNALAKWKYTGKGRVPKDKPLETLAEEKVIDLVSPDTLGKTTTSTQEPAPWEKEIRKLRTEVDDLKTKLDQVLTQFASSVPTFASRPTQDDGDDDDSDEGSTTKKQRRNCHTSYQGYHPEGTATPTVALDDDRKPAATTGLSDEHEKPSVEKTNRATKEAETKDDEEQETPLNQSSDKEEIPTENEKDNTDRAEPENKDDEEEENPADRAEKKEETSAETLDSKASPRRKKRTRKPVGNSSYNFRGRNTDGDKTI